MKKSKTQKGITLIALIITIVVSLTLSAVAIGGVQNDGIIDYAKNARNEYQAAQKNEQTTTFNNYSGLLNENDPNNVKWIQNGTEVTNGKIKLAVGDTVNYVSNADTVTYNEESEEETTKKYETELGGGWKVLGAENGEILLMSTQNVYNTLDYGGLYLEGADGYFTGVSQLNTICEAYGNGEHASKTTKARSIKVEDVNRVTGYNPRNVGVYDPLQTGEGVIYNQGTISQYENEVTYTLGEYNRDVGCNLIEYSGTNGVSGEDAEDYKGYFKMPDGTILTEDKPIKLTSNYYYYNPTTLTINGGTEVGLATNSEAYKMLFRNEANTANISYWLSSSYIFTGTETTSFGIRSVDNGIVFYSDLWHTGKGACNDTKGVRAVVSLDSNVTLKQNGENSWTLS